eukprot:m.286670 g.286670  ORF g.286670 m.286670 type:complete len:89 (+) comp17779_c0_seq1:7572-7838(+)
MLKHQAIDTASDNWPQERNNPRSRPIANVPNDSATADCDCNQLETEMAWKAISIPTTANLYSLNRVTSVGLQKAAECLQRNAILPVAW